MIKRITFSSLISIFSIFNLSAQDIINVEFIETVNRSTLEFLLSTTFDNGVDLYKVNYTTNDVHGVLDTASGLLALPDIDNEYSLLCYQHGTVSNPDSVPSRGLANAFLPVAFAARGYIVTAADYLGLGDSRGFHPYLHAETQATAAIDLMRAARTHIETLESHSLSPRVYISGYSQGGHAAMAAHREIQQNYSDEFTVTASSPMSGPYSISDISNSAILDDQGEYTQPSYIPNILLGLNEAYGNLYTSIDEAFKPTYADMCTQFFNKEITLSVLNGMLINQLIQDFGRSTPRFMFNDDYIAAVESNDNHPVNVALRDNDLFDWVPEAPMRLFYCEADEQVPFQNSVFTDSIMNANGAMDVMSESQGANLSHGGCAPPAAFATIAFFDSFEEMAVNTEDLNIGEIGFNLYPNPAQNQLNIEIGDTSSDQFIQIMDLNGKQFVNMELGQNTTNVINTAHLTNGFYLVKITSENKTGLRKLIIQR